MRLFKPPDNLGLTRFYIAWIVLLLPTWPVTLCANQWSGFNEDMKTVEDPNCPVASSCDDFTKIDTLSSSLDRKTEFETGIDFIRDDLHLSLEDRELYFGTDEKALKRRNMYSAMPLVLRFIRSIKQLPAEKQGDESPIGSGTNLQLKPDWCYYPFSLKKLVQVELNIYKILRRFYFEHGRKAKFISLESYLLDIEESSMRAIRNVETSNKASGSHEDPYLYVASHPTLIYRLVRRFAEDLQPILKQIEQHQSGNGVISSLYEDANPELLVFPTGSDLNDALEAIRRMQHGNDLDTYQIARGIFVDVDTGIHLTALHALEIGTDYIEHRDHDLAIQWIHFALETVKKSPAVKNYPEIEEFFKYFLEAAVEGHNTNFINIFNNHWDPGVFNSTVVLPFEPTAYMRRLHQLYPLAVEQRSNTAWNWAIKANFKRVCSGVNIQTEAEIAMLKCWYHRWHNRYWFINPLKAELLHMNPPVFQIYEFIGDKLIEAMKQTAVFQLKRSTVVDRASATKSKVDSTRTSSQTWLYDEREEGKFLQPLSKKMELMSGLTILPPTSSDAYQVASYGPSHHYEAHIDSFEDPRRAAEKGNRITTIMGYLSDVKVGGRTGFPVLGISADPIKGSIVMWDNLKRNGEKRDERSWHGGCPVVLGIKWITNKWVYYNDNVFNFQCTLDPNE